MAVSPEGTLFVGTRDNKVYALVDRNKDGVADVTHVVAEGLNSPNGVAYRDGDLYIAEIHRIVKLSNIDKHLFKPPKPSVVFDKLPNKTHHGWRYIRFGPNGWLYVGIGAPCNVCEEKDPRFASIYRLNVTTKVFLPVAKGVRNTVGFDFHPSSQNLWFTDNGRDWLGDDKPPCELNELKKEGEHFGFPFCHGSKVDDPEFSAKKTCKDFKKPVMELGAHVAPLGMRFYTGRMFPARYWNQILVAEHGSWNRSKKVGYRVQLARFVQSGNTYESFIRGWLQPGEKVLGRPVDILVLKDGSVLVSDDYAHAIYRITYQ